MNLLYIRKMHFRLIGLEFLGDEGIVSWSPSLVLRIEQLGSIQSTSVETLASQDWISVVHADVFVRRQDGAGGLATFIAVGRKPARLLACHVTL